MDMRKKLGPWLTGTALHAMGGRYDGTILRVEEKAVWNRWRKATTLEAVITFEDGKQLVLNRTTQVELMDRFGHESDAWIGKRIIIVCRPVERADGKTGWEKVLLPAELESVAPEWVDEADDDPDLSDPISAHDEDDIALEARRFGRRRG